MPVPDRPRPGTAPRVVIGRGVSTAGTSFSLSPKVFGGAVSTPTLRVIRQPDRRSPDLPRVNGRRTSKTSTPHAAFVGSEGSSLARRKAFALVATLIAPVVVRAPALRRLAASSTRAPVAVRTVPTIVGNEKRTLGLPEFRPGFPLIMAMPFVRLRTGVQ